MVIFNCKNEAFMETIRKLDALEINLGDIILIHSSIGRIAKAISPDNPREFCEIFYKYLSEKVGAGGTLIFPTFNFGFCSGKPFSMKGTKSEMGALTNYILSRPEAKRTKHPIYSFAVIGKYAELFSSIDNKSAYSDESLFGEIKRRNGKIMIIDLPYNHSMTFFHHVEEIENVSYRYHKNFSGIYIDKEGKTSEKIYSLFVRNLEMGVTTEVEPMGKLFEEKGFVRQVSFENSAFVKIMRAKELFDFTVENMRKDPYLLYKIEKRQ